MDAKNSAVPKPTQMKRMFRPRNGGESEAEYAAMKAAYEKTVKRADSRGSAIISMMKSPKITDDSSEAQPYEP